MKNIKKESKTSQEVFYEMVIAVDERSATQFHIKISFRNNKIFIILFCKYTQVIYKSRKIIASTATAIRFFIVIEFNERREEDRGGGCVKFNYFCGILYYTMRSSSFTVYKFINIHQHDTDEKFDPINSHFRCASS